jgi:putative redox protein
MEVLSEKITLIGSHGHKLAARLDRPKGEVRCYAVYAPCFTCTKDVHAAVRIASGLAERGIATLRLDFTGIGESEGLFAETNFSSTVEDLLAAIAYLKNQHRTPHLLIGHSLGGTAALVATQRSADIQAVVTINSPCQPKHVSRHFLGVEEELHWKGEADVEIAGRKFTIQKHFFDDLQTYNMDTILPNLGAALLVLHAPQDDLVHITNANDIFSKALHPKSFISLDGVDHLITQRRDAEYIAELISTWSAHFLRKNCSKGHHPSTSISVQESGMSKYSQLIQIGHHQLIADEPEFIEGGENRGPSPYDYLLAALGSCTAMTLRMYADFNKIPLEKVSVALKHDKIHAEDCQDCQTKNGIVDYIRCDLILEGRLTAQEKDKLLHIANKCPVHKTLTNEVKIRTRLRD